MSDEVDPTHKYNLQKAVLAADYYTDRQPRLARHYMFEGEELRSKINVALSPSHQVCSFCGLIFRPGNHTARVRPKMKVNRKLDKIVSQSRNGKHIKSKFTRKLAKLYSETKNRLVLQCSMCHHRTVIPCQGRRPKKTPEQSQADVPLTYQQKRKMKKRIKRRSKAQQQNTPSVTPGHLNSPLVTPSPPASGDTTKSGVASFVTPASATSIDSGVSPSLSASSVSSPQMKLFPQMTSTPLPARSPAVEKRTSTITDSSGHTAYKSFTLNADKCVGSNISSGYLSVSNQSLAKSEKRMSHQTSNVNKNSSLRNTSGVKQNNSRNLGDRNAASASQSKKKKKGPGLHNVLQKMLAQDKSRKESSNDSLQGFLSSL